MNNGRRIAWWQWLWAKLSQFESKIDWVRVFFWFGLIAIGVIIVTFLASLIIKLLGVWEWLYLSESQLPNHRYLLSATAQLLAAIFALVFSITLIGTQFVTKYTHRTMRIIFSRRIFFYIVGFAFAVIFPLWWIVTPMGIGSFLSVVIASLFVLSIPGFFVYLIRKMGIEGVIAHIKKVAIEAVRAEDETNATAMINALDNIGMGAYTDRNFEVFELAYEALANLAFEIEKESGELKDGMDEKELHQLLIKNLRNACEEVIENPRAPCIITKKVTMIGESAIDSSKCPLTLEAVANFFYDFESLISEDTSIPLSRHRKSLSAYFLEHLHEVTKKSLVAHKNKKELDNQCLLLVYFETKIHKRHLIGRRIWGEHLKDESIQATDLAKKLIHHFKQFAPLKGYLFDYLRFFFDTANNPRAGAFCTDVTIILRKLVEGQMSEELIEFFMEKFQDYGDEFLNAGGEWGELGGKLYEQLALNASKVLEKHKNYTLCHRFQQAYFPIMKSNKYIPKLRSGLISQTLEQTSLLLKSKSKEFDQEWIKEITGALNLATYEFIRRKEAKEYPELWNEIKLLNRRLLRFVLNRSWPEAMNSLNGLFVQLMWSNESVNVVLPRNELFKNVWLSLAALLSLGQEPPIDTLASNMKRHKGVLPEFCQEYPNAEIEAEKLKKKWKIPEFLQKAKPLLNKALYKETLPRCS